MITLKKLFLTFIHLFLSASVLLAGVDGDGTDDFADVGTATNIPTGGNMSIFAVFSSDATSGMAISRQDSGAGVSDNWFLGVIASGADFQVRFQKKKSTFQEHHSVTGSGIFTVGSTVRVAASMNTDNNVCGINVNGTDDTTCSFRYNENINSPAGVTFLAQRNGASRSGFLNGTVYHVCIYNTNLDATNRARLVNGFTKNICKQVSPSNLVAEWHLQDAPHGESLDGDTFADMTSNNNDATGDNGANNTGLTAVAEKVLSYEE